MGFETSIPYGLTQEANVSPQIIIIQNMSFTVRKHPMTYADFKGPDQLHIHTVISESEWPACVSKLKIPLKALFDHADVYTVCTGHTALLTEMFSIRNLVFKYTVKFRY